MMKSFFKKLAFVMALAMVVTTAAPAAKSVYAADMKLAYQTGGVVTELNMKVGDQEDLRFLGAPADWKSLDMKWSSNNEAVATVDKNGAITAVKDGVAVITFALSDGTAASVTVNVGNVKPYDVTLGTADNKAMTTAELKVGESIDLNFYGVKDWNRNNYVVGWFADSDVVTVDKNGIVEAVKAGTAVVTATIVNTATGVAHNVTPVTVTVPSEVVTPAFEVKQIDTVTVALEFANKMDLSEVTVDDFEVTAIDETFEYTLFANTATVNGNGVTLTFVEGVLTDGAVIKIGYKGAEATLVASNGEVATVEVSYGMNKNYDGNAYVYTELDPDYVLLSYKLYDANGIDVTAKYTEDEDYTIEWTLVSGSDIVDDEPYADENGWQMSFSAKGVAAVQAAVTFTDEDGEDRVVTSEKTNIVAVNRPAIAFTYEEAGLVTIDKANKLAQVASFNAWYGTIWSTDAYTSSITKGTGAEKDDGTRDSVWFAARLTDNRGNGLVSTTLEWEDDGKGKNTGDANGNTEYGDYGYFVYESSNEDVLMIDDEGRVEAVEVGSATILVSFVKYSEDGEEMAPVKVCSKKINVTTNYPNPYAKTFEIINDSLTVTSTGSSMTANAYVKFYDQYGNAYSGFTAGDVNAALLVTVPSTYEGATVEIAEGPVWESATGSAPAYKITVSGEDLNDLYTIKDNGYYTFKFTLAFDTDMDEFSKITTKNDKLSVKVYNVDNYYADLTKFYDGDFENDYTKWNYVVSGGASLDVYVDKRSEFGTGSTSDKPTKSVSVALYSNAGLKLMDLPEEYFIDITGKKVDDINKNEQDTLVEGAIYYQISQPSKAKNVHVATGSAVTFTFNEVKDTEIELATTGNYTVTLYYVNSKHKLVKLDTKTVTITNSTPAVKAEGFISTNVSDEKITDANIKEVLEKMYNFSWNGELLYADYGTREHKSENFRISDVKYDLSDNKVVVTKVIFEIDYFNNCAIDGVGGVDNHAGDLHQIYELNKRITIKY